MLTYIFWAHPQTVVYEIEARTKQKKQKKKRKKKKRDEEPPSSFTQSCVMPTKHVKADVGSLQLITVLFVHVFDCNILLLTLIYSRSIYANKVRQSSVKVSWSTQYLYFRGKLFLRGFMRVKSATEHREKKTESLSRKSD